MASRQSVSWDDRALALRLQNARPRAEKGLAAITTYQAARIQGVIRRRAPWTDRTTNARNGLFAKPIVEMGKTYAIVLHHSVPYGIWLEVRWSGRFSIVEKSLHPEGVKVMLAVSKLFDRIFK